MNQMTAALPRHDPMLVWRPGFLRDVVLGLARPRKAIPCTYFYDEIGSALFETICDLDEYYLTRTELAILRAHVSEMAAVIGEDCELVELGSGSGLKTHLLLKRLKRLRGYFPIDVDRVSLERMASDMAGHYPGLRVFPVHADFTGQLVLPASGDPPARRVVFFPGSTIGNFSPGAAVDLLRTIARLAGPRGGLLIGLDLDKDESIVWPAYNDRRGVTALFNLNLLARINRELGGDFDLSAFAHRATYLRHRERVEMHLLSQAAQAVRIGGFRFEFEEGETIHTEYSYKYSLDHFARLTARAGFTLVRQWLDPQEYFAVQYLMVT
jgi:dimethylhistidine N-methyltransferase